MSHPRRVATATTRAHPGRRGPGRSPPHESGPDRSAAPNRSWAVAGLTAALLLGALTYAPSLRVPFQFDDILFVRDNPALRVIWPPQSWIRSHFQETRPLTNLTFALNYAWTRTDPWSYHLVNLALHLGSVVLLFQFVRVALKRLTVGPPTTQAVAAAAAMLLSVHTVHSESVIYIQGRPGMLVTFFGLAALVNAARALPPRNAASTRPSRSTTAWGALWTLLAALSKESAAVIPALVLLYDVALVARGRLSELRSRLVGFHLPHWGALLVLPVLFATLQNPHKGVFGTEVVDPFRFYLTQPLVVLFYLRLYLYPVGLTIDHGFALAQPGDVRVWYALAGVSALLVATAWALRRWPWPGFCAAWWLLAVAPTSLLPGREFAAERYLTFASPAFAALLAWALVAAGSSLSATRGLARMRIGLAATILLALALAWHTRRHGDAWQSGRELWQKAIALQPGNTRARQQLAWFLWQENRPEEAEREVRRVLALDPSHTKARDLLARVQMELGQADSALANAAWAAAGAPGNPDVHVTHAIALLQLGRWSEALAACDRVLRLAPDHDLAFYYRAQCRAALGDTAQARADGWALERRRPDAGLGPHLLGSLELGARRDSSAARWLELAVRRDPQHIEAMRLLPLAWYRLDRPGEALDGWRRYFSRSSAGRTDYFMLYYTGLALQQLGRHAAAAETMRQVIRIRPELGLAWIELAYALAAPGDPASRDTGAARSALVTGERLADGANPAVRVRVAEVRDALAAAGRNAPVRTQPE